MYIPIYSKINAKKRAIFLLAIIVIAFFFGIKEAFKIQNELILYDPELKESLPYADDMLKRVYGTSKPFSDKSTAEIAKYLNQLVFSHCQNKLPHTGANDINELFSNCRTACGGYAYVLRALLNTYGISTRYSNFYNIPAQGNHTAVEVEVEDGRWSLFDPTFGIFFTLDGDPEGTPLSTEEVRFLLDENSIDKSAHIVSTKRIIAENPKVKNLYGQEFSSDFFKLKYYLLAEQSVSVGVDALVPLVLPIDLENGYVKFGSKTFQNLSNSKLNFLKDTNDRLNNDVLSDDVSYLYHIVGRDVFKDFRSMNIIRMSSLKPGTLYDMKVFGYIPNYSKIQIVPIGRSAKINIVEPHSFTKGNFVIQRLIKAEETSSNFVITGSQNFFIFGVEVKIIKR